MWWWMISPISLDVREFPVLYIEPYLSYGLERSYDVGVVDLDVGKFPVLYIEPYLSYGLERSYDVGVLDQVETVAVFGDKLSHDRSSKTGDGRSALWEKWRKMSPFLAPFDRVY